ncbi:MAG: hypothetical protein ABIP30_10065 [Ferruginibacter sp.]
MKIRRILYFSVGVFLIICNILIDILHYKEFYAQSNDIAYTLGSILGGHILLVIGLFLFRASYKLKKKINLLNNKSLEMDIDSIGRLDK